MALSITYTFVDGTTANAAEVNRNFTDLVTYGLDKRGDTMTGALVISSGGASITGGITVPTGNLAFTGTSQGIVFEGTAADDYELTLVAANPGADVTVTLPAATDTLVGKATTDTLTNKTLTSPSIATPTITGAVTLTGGQITFPVTQSASADVNTLDDYEEGTWTPVIGGSGGTSGQTYTTQVGVYTKIGRLVMVTFTCTFSAKGTITDNLQVQGLPFTAANLANSFAVGALVWDSLAANWVNIVAYTNPNGTTANIRGAAAAAASNNTALTTADVDNDSTFIGTIVYTAS